LKPSAAPRALMSQESKSENTQHHIFDYLRVLSVRWPIVLVIFLLVAISTGVITFLLPKQYLSVALIQVQENSDFEIFQANSGRGFNPQFTTTQFEIIRSKEIILPVIRKLDLEHKWAERYDIKSRELVYRKLLSMITLDELRNTDLISISVLSPDRTEA